MTKKDRERALREALNSSGQKALNVGFNLAASEEELAGTLMKPYQRIYRSQAG